MPSRPDQLIGQQHLLPDATAVAETAVRTAVRVLQAAIAAHGNAVWVLAGGTSPMAAYRVLAESGDLPVDWSAITLLIGDERLVPLDDPDSNLGSILPVLAAAGAGHARTLIPAVDADPADAAERYAADLATLDTTESGCPRLDVVWLGIGEDGHTLSLFPGKPSLSDTQHLTLGITDSPKPPPRRVTLALRALDGAQHVTIFATGAGKQHALQQIRDGAALPAAIVAGRAVSAGAQVDWLIDSAADGA